MSEKSPLISVCMATFNGAEFIAQQIESILTQLGPNDELIISDDGSTDATCKIVAAFDDKRIKLITNSSTSGPVCNFQYALQHASGDLIFLADQDDLWEPNKVIIQVGLLGNYDLVVSDCCLIDVNGSLVADSFFKLRGSGAGFIKNLYQNSFLGCCMAFRRSVMNKALPFPPSIAMHDIWIGLVAELYGTTCFCPEKLVRYRRHSATATKTGGRSSFSTMHQIAYRWQLLCSAIRRKVFGR